MANVRHLGATRKIAAKTGKEYVRHALAVLIEEVVARKQSQVCVVVHTAASLVIREPYRRGYRRKLSVPHVFWRNELQQVLGRHGKRTAWYLGSWEYAGRRISTARHIVRFPSCYRISQSG